MQLPSNAAERWLRLAPSRQSTCLTATVDGSSGASHIIGIALDGFPVYGGRDINGNVISLSQLDGCNGITSATPEFPSGTYHYVLPIGVTSYQSSLQCYAGTVSQKLMAQAYKRHCDMKTFKLGKPPAPPRNQPSRWTWQRWGCNRVPRVRQASPLTWGYSLVFCRQAHDPT